MWSTARNISGTDNTAITFSHTRQSPSHTGVTIANNTTTSAVSSSSFGSSRVNHYNSISGMGPSSSSGSARQQQRYVNSTSGTGTSTGIGTGSGRNRPYGNPVSFCSFYYLDAFVILSCKSSLYMYRYNPDSPDASNDLKRTLAQGSYKLVKEWDFREQAQSICATACMNAVQSPLLFCTTSDKLVHIVDASCGLVVRSIPSPHGKNIHHIALPTPSVHVPLSPEMYNTFLTSATDNVIHMWDIRCPDFRAGSTGTGDSTSGLLSFSSHVNTRECIQCDISPCLRYVATGSEDKTTRIYDIRMGRELAKLTGHRDCVSSVAFNPLFPQLASASYDGTVKFYVDPGCAATQVGV